jgi:hypothetical protein
LYKSHHNVDRACPTTVCFIKKHWCFFAMQARFAASGRVATGSMSAPQARELAGHATGGTLRVQTNNPQRSADTLDLA